MRIYQVDAFADRPFSGNPAGVCIMTEPRDDGWMQSVAAEMNLSETAFVRQSGRLFNLRWFTPVTEVELCGHGTLATAHILWETGAVPGNEQLSFQTASGLLQSSLRGELIELDFPSRPPQETALPPGLIEALGVTPRYVGRSGRDYVVEVDSEESVRALRPSFAGILALPLRGLMVTSRATSAGYDFVSRFFAPSVGVDEDPVTGSAHCCLGPFWSKRLGREKLKAYQASPRGGAISVLVDGHRVHLGGRAVTVMSGELVDL